MRRAIITGGEGDLATKIREVLERSGDYEILAPSRTELDVSEPAVVAAFFAEIESVDLLINNAGITRDRILLNLKDSEWDEVVRINLKGAFLCAQAAAKLMMRQRRGHLIQIGSYSALNPPMGQCNYAAAKAGLIGLTKSLAQELGSRNIQSNCVLPGFLETKMTAGVSDEARSRALELHALNRFNTTSEAAEFILFLARSENISGQVFQLDSRIGKWS